MTGPSCPAFFGLSGTALTADEMALFGACNPAGYILFTRNIADPDQARRLTDDLRALSGRDDLPILIDQEGGPVARLRPPHWPELPAADRFGACWEVAPATAIAAARANAEAIALMLTAIGITVNCMPLLDIALEHCHPVIGSRAFGRDVHCVAALGRAVLTGLADGGVAGVIKHMPGQGRAIADSHDALPVVDASSDQLMDDLEPFRQLNDAPMSMTAHVTYTAWDADHCATHSATVIDRIIRQDIGFDGLLMTDGIEMSALHGPMGERARRALSAGVDVVLHCTGDLTEMADIVDAVAGDMQIASLGRLERAMHGVGSSLEPKGERIADALARRDALLKAAAEEGIG